MLAIHRRQSCGQHARFIFAAARRISLVDISLVGCCLPSIGFQASCSSKELEPKFCVEGRKQQILLWPILPPKHTIDHAQTLALHLTLALTLTCTWSGGRNTSDWSEASGARERAERETEHTRKL